MSHEDPTQPSTQRGAISNPEDHAGSPGGSSNSPSLSNQLADMAENRLAPAWLERTGRSSWAFLGIAGAAILIVLALTWMRAIVVPLVLSAFLAVVFAPMVDWLEARKVPRSIGAVLVIVMIAAVFAVTAWVVSYGITQRSDELSSALDDAQSQIQDLADKFNLNNILDEMRNDGDSAGTFLSGGVGAAVTGTLSWLIGLVSGLILGIMLLYYLLKDGHGFASAMVRRSSPTATAQAQRIQDKATASIRSYFLGRSILAVAQGAAVALLLWPMGVPLPIAAGLVNVVGAYVPYLGAWVGGAFAVVMGLAGGGLSLALWSLFVVLFVNLVLENVLEPKVMGSTMDLPPIVVLLATVAGGLMAGLVGLVLASPLVSIMIVVYREAKQSGFFSPAGVRRPPS
ncbi:MAG: AI-2E family transporter [Acidimicrobiia bacterium]|nr:AI-2E family transporter [Acidimicrobiia bacterium]